MLSFLTFFPLIGGYFAVSTLYFTSIQSARADGYRLIIYALGAGFLLYLISSALAPGIYFCVERVDFLTSGIQTLRNYFTVNNNHSALTLFKGGSTNFQFLIACLSLIIGWPLALFLNALGRIELRPFYFLSRDFAVQRSTLSRADPLESFLNEAVHSTTPVLLTLKSGKVYVGTVTSEINPAYDPASVQIVMSRSGFRDRDNHQVVLNTDYEAIENAIKAGIEKRSFAIVDSMRQSKNIKNSDIEKFIEVVIDALGDDSDSKILAHQRVVAIPYLEIASIHPFDETIYDTHQEQVGTEIDDEQLNSTE